MIPKIIEQCLIFATLLIVSGTIGMTIGKIWCACDDIKEIKIMLKNILDNVYLKEKANG